MSCPPPSRRRVIRRLGGLALGWPAIAAAQPAAMRVVGVLRVNGRDAEQFAAPFRRDMRKLGWEEDRNVRFEYRFADGRSEALPTLARELAALKVDVIAAFGNPGTAAVQAATRTIPIVGMTDDMVSAGLAASMAHPGGNTTGVSIFANTLDPKRLEILHEFVPRARRFGLLGDSRSSPNLAGVERAARALGLETIAADAVTHDAVDPALDALERSGVEAVNVLASPVLHAARGRIIERSRTARLPAIYEWPETAAEGGLVGYGARITLCYRHVAVLVDKVLRGAKAGELPIEQPTIFTLAINARTAQALGLDIPPLLLRADEVIE